MICDVGVVSVVIAFCCVVVFMRCMCLSSWLFCLPSSKLLLVPPLFTLLLSLSCVVGSTPMLDLIEEAEAPIVLL